MLYTKGCCEYYNIDSDFNNLGFINETCLQVYQSAHVLIREDTHNLTTHTYGIHNDITKHNQPDATVINVN